MPVNTVAFGSDLAGMNSKDVAIRNVVAGLDGFREEPVPDQRRILARGLRRPNARPRNARGRRQEIPVATQRLKVPEGGELLPITGIKYVPQTAGEKKLTFRVKPKEGELVLSNNEISTFCHGPQGGFERPLRSGATGSAWEQKYFLPRGGAPPRTSRPTWLKRPVSRGDTGQGELPDELFTYPSATTCTCSLTTSRQLPHAHATGALHPVGEERGRPHHARRPFQLRTGRLGAERTSRTCLPVGIMKPTDRQITPEGGIRFLPNTQGIDSYLLQIAPTKGREPDSDLGEPRFPPPRREPPGRGRNGTRSFSDRPGGAPEPVIVGTEAAQGAWLAFGGETWISAHARRRRPDRLSAVLAAGDLLARPQGRQGRERGEAEPRCPAGLRRREARLRHHRPRRKGRPHPRCDLQSQGPSAKETTSSSPRLSTPSTKGADRGDFYNEGRPARRLPDLGRSIPGRQGDWPRLRPVHRLPGRQGDRKSRRRQPAMKQIAKASGGESLTPDQLPKYLDSLRARRSVNRSARPRRRSGTTGLSCSSSPRSLPWNGGSASGTVGSEKRSGNKTSEGTKEQKCKSAKVTVVGPLPVRLDCGSLGITSHIVNTCSYRFLFCSSVLLLFCPSALLFSHSLIVSEPTAAPPRQ